MKINNTTFLSIGLFGLALLLGTSCGPDPKSAQAPEDPIQLTTEVSREEQESFGKYAIKPGNISFFLWPDQKDLEILAQRGGPRNRSEAAAIVGENSSRLDDLYRMISPITNEYLKLGNQKSELWEKHREANYNPFRLKRRKEILAGYACFVGETGPRNKCLREAAAEDKPSSVKIPTDCGKLRTPPWKSNQQASECSKSEGAIYDEFEAAFNEENAKLIADIKELESKKEEYNASITNIISTITSAVDPESDPDKMTNWIQVDSTLTTIEHKDKDSTPILKLYLRFNNLKDNNHSKYLLYTNEKTDQQPEPDIITEDKLTLEKGATTLKFILREKRVVPVLDQTTGTVDTSKTEYTGDTYEVTLRRSIQEFGLLYLGKIKKFNAQKQHVGDGIMKVILLEEFE